MRPGAKSTAYYFAIIILVAVTEIISFKKIHNKKLCKVPCQHQRRNRTATPLNGHGSGEFFVKETNSHNFSLWPTISATPKNEHDLLQYSTSSAPTPTPKKREVLQSLGKKGFPV